jgi:hypothetical protein
VSLRLHAGRRKGRRSIKTRELRFEYRGNLLSTKVTTRSTLHLKVRNRRGTVVR